MIFAHFLKVRYRKWVIGSAFFLLVASLIFISYRSHNKTAEKQSAFIEREFSKTNPRFAIKGFSFEEYKNGKKILTIQADSFIVDKKKIGFFRFGLLNAAKLNNAEINVYAIDDSSLNTNSYSHSETVHDVNKIDFENLFSPAIFHSIIKKRITSLEISPIIIRAHDTKGVTSTIHSGYSKINLTKGTITFKKKVRVKAGPNILTAKELHFDPKQNIYQTNSPFFLKTVNEELHGDYLEIDLFLNRIVAIHCKNP
ncbi:MAG: hypothetical protein ACMUJM_16005 [bacterium]